MKTIKKLPVNQDSGKIELGKIKIEKDDVVILKDPDNNFDYSSLMGLSKAFDYKNIIVILKENTTLETANESDMNKAGWFKKYRGIK